MAELMEAEVSDLAGRKGRHDPARRHSRHGSVTLGGRRVPIGRPRVRSVGIDAATVPLDSYAAFASSDLLAEGIVARMLAGDLDAPVLGGARAGRRQVVQTAMSTSKSAESRRFVAATAERLPELCGRRLDDRHWPIVMLKGLHLGEHLLVVAFGVTDDGTRVPLGVVEGRRHGGARRAPLHPPSRPLLSVISLRRDAV